MGALDRLRRPRGQRALRRVRAAASAGTLAHATSVPHAPTSRRRPWSTGLATIRRVTASARAGVSTRSAARASGGGRAPRPGCGGRGGWRYRGPAKDWRGGRSLNSFTAQTSLRPARARRYAKSRGNPRRGLLARARRGRLRRRFTLRLAWYPGDRRHKRQGFSPPRPLGGLNPRKTPGNCPHLTRRTPLW